MAGASVLSSTADEGSYLWRGLVDVHIRSDGRPAALECQSHGSLRDSCARRID
jgi:hypothetical protein